MGLFSKKKEKQPEKEVEEAAPVPDFSNIPRLPKAGPTMQDTDTGFALYQARAAPLSSDPLEAAAQRKAQKDAAILDAIFQAFARMLPTYGSKMKNYMPLTTSDYEFNEGNYVDRYRDLERQICAHMEQRGWKVKEFSIKDSKERSKSTLTKYYPKVKWVWNCLVFQVS